MPATFYISFQNLGMSVLGFLILLREFFSPFLQKVLPGQHGHLLGNRLHKYIFFHPGFSCHDAESCRSRTSCLEQYLAAAIGPIYIHTNSRNCFNSSHSRVLGGRQILMEETAHTQNLRGGPS